MDYCTYQIEQCRKDNDTGPSASAAMELEGWVGWREYGACPSRYCKTAQVSFLSLHSSQWCKFHFAHSFSLFWRTFEMLVVTLVPYALLFSWNFASNISGHLNVRGQRSTVTQRHANNVNAFSPIQLCMLTPENTNRSFGVTTFQYIGPIRLWW